MVNAKKEYYGASSPNRFENLLIPRHEHDVMVTNSIILDNIVTPYIDLRSSLRRLGCYARIPAMMGAYGWGSMGPHSYTITTEIVNYGDIEISLNKGDKIAQAVFRFDSPTKEELDNEHIYLIGGDAKKEEYRKRLELDHGWEVETTKELKSLVRKGYMKVEPELSPLKGTIEVHAGKHAKVLKKDIKIDFSSKQDISNAFKDVDLPYELKPGEYIDIETAESFDFSGHVGVLFTNEPPFPSRHSHMSFIRERDHGMRFIWTGWVDPGYAGAFSRQPKTYFKDGMTIKEGDVLGYGTVVFFPNGVERKYGNKDLDSHYSNSESSFIWGNKNQRNPK
jgi:deoxycytidine triphosphate deaminase